MIPPKRVAIIFGIIFFTFLIGSFLLTPIIKTALKTAVTAPVPEATINTANTDSTADTNATTILDNVVRDGALSVEAIPGSSTAFKAGDLVTFQINVNTNDRPVSAIDSIIVFDPAVLKVSSVIPGTKMDSYPLKSVSDNYINLSGLKSPGTTASGTFILGTFEVEFLTKGQTDLKFLFEKGETIDSNIVDSINSEDILGKVTDLTLTIE